METTGLKRRLFINNLSGFSVHLYREFPSLFRESNQIKNRPMDNENDGCLLDHSTEMI
jgi:hypothetical protein